MSDSAWQPTTPVVPPHDPRDPAVGALIGERYRILQRIGEGGMGAVYRAEHVLMKKIVAVKLLHAELGGVDEAARRFEREAQSASRLNHPNIVAVTDFGRTATGQLFLVMELVSGEALADRLDREKPLPVVHAVEIAKQVLAGLEHAHGEGVIHRDLKPANVMLARSTDGRPGVLAKLLDFGIAKISQDGEGDRPLTQGAMVFGTPSYMSPEQATAQDADARSDLYSCGVMLYEMLAGRKPFVADDLVKVMALHVTASPPPLSRVAPEAEIPFALEAVVMRALEKDRARRFQSAADFRAALDRARTPGVLLLVQRLPSLWARALAASSRAFGRLPWKARRWAPLAVAAAVALALLPVFFAGGGAAPTARPPPPKPLDPGLKVPIGRIEDAIARGRLPEARLLIMQQVSEHPDNGRVRYLLGNLEHAEKNAAAGMSAYAEALRRDPGLRGDAALLVNTAKIVPDRALGRQALDLMIKQIGTPASQALAEIASGDKRPEFRRAARAACEDLGCTKKIDLARSYALDMQQARRCEERRAAIAALAATKDAQAVAPLRRARREATGLLGRFSDYHCVRADLQKALDALGEEGR